MAEIQDIIKSQLDANKSGLEWARAYLKTSQLSETRERLIRNRIRLKRILRASEVNPAAAVFGESQVGKSYMVDCLLTSEKSVLNVYDGKGNATGFLEYINPIGGGKEATSLISRFTIDKVWKNDEFPIRVELLSPIDVVMVVVDTYFNDVKNHQLPKPQEITEEIARLSDIYDAKNICQSVISEDEIFELKEYFTMSLLERGESFREALLDAGYFDTLARIIPNINVSEWPGVFSFLWNHETQLTNVFSLLMRCFESLDFSQTVYIKTDAVLRSGGTILHVDRIYELFGITELKNDKGEIRTVEPARIPTMEVLTQTGRVVPSVSKGEFCAISMEVAFTITDPADPAGGINKEKPFLDTIDILDFPGARSRKMFDAGAISKDEACEMMLRGKVAYLFNKYSQQYLISNLLFCHHSDQSNVSTLASLLKGWIATTVGETPAERQTFMQNTGGVPPLFLIGTKFNIDLEKTPDDSKGDDASKENVRNYRWNKRFGNLLNLLGQNDVNNWLSNWEPGKPFHNTFLLRSYEYSCQRGLFHGYQQQDENGDWKLTYTPDGALRGEQGINDEYRPFIESLRESFMNNDFVKRLFADPKESWRRVIGEYGGDGKWWPQDGAEYIIEQLTKSSGEMSSVRDLQFSRISGSCFDCLVKTLHDFYHDDNSDAELRRQMTHAGSINLTFDALFGKDKYFFSDFISALTIEEEHLHDVVLDTINDPSVVEQTDLSMLFAIRAKAGVNPNDPYEDNVARLREAYNCDSDEELDNRLSSLGISIEEIINPPKVMNFSMLISEAIVKAWTNTHLRVERYNDFVQRGLNKALLQSLFDNLEALFINKVKMSDRMAKRIHPYVSSSAGTLDEMSDMLADICSEMINKFINTAGAAYYDDEIWNDIEQTIRHNDFDLTTRRAAFTEISIDEDSVRNRLPDVFDSFDNIDTILNQVPVDTNRLAHFSNYDEYRKWIDLMKISFLATAGIPKYNPDMNNALRKVLVGSIVTPEPLSDLVASNSLLGSLKTLNVG